MPNWYNKILTETKSYALLFLGALNSYQNLLKITLLKNNCSSKLLSSSFDKTIIENVRVK